MALPRPNTITSLADAHKNCKPGPAHAIPLVNLMGIVIDVLLPTQTRTGGISRVLYICLVFLFADAITRMVSYFYHPGLGHDEALRLSKGSQSSILY
jgi:hypothetical protein